MIYVMLHHWREGIGQEEVKAVIARRAQWKYPAGAKSLGEYWPASNDLAVVAVMEADDFAPLMEIMLTWGDVFETSTFPAVTAEEGLKMGSALVERMGA